MFVRSNDFGGFPVRSFAPVLIATLLVIWTSAAEARGVRPTVCNETGYVVLVAMVDSDLRSPRALTTEVYSESGWWKVSPGNCRRLRELNIGWRAFAFAALENGSIRPFIYTPSQQRTGSRPPSFSSICANSAGRSFGRNDVLETDVGKTCAEGADQVVPISFKIEVGIFTDVALTIKIAGVPNFIGPPPEPSPPSNFFVLGEISGCEIVAAPSLMNAELSVSGEIMSPDDVFDFYMSKAVPAINRFQRELRCSEIQALRSQFYPFINDDSGGTFNVFMYDEGNGLERDNQSGVFSVPESEEVYQRHMYVLGIERLR